MILLILNLNATGDVVRTTAASTRTIQQSPETLTHLVMSYARQHLTSGGKALAVTKALRVAAGDGAKSAMQTLGERLSSHVVSKVLLS